MKKQNTTTIWLIIVIVATGLIFYFLVSQQIKNKNIISIDNQANLTTNREDRSNRTDQANSADSENNSPASQNSQSKVEEPNLASSDDSQEVIKNLTKKSFFGSNEKAVQEQIDNFYQYLAAENFNSTFSLFDSKVRISAIESQIISRKPTLLQSYKIESIDIRSDETAIAETLETKNNLTEKKFFELAPTSGNNKLFRYFKISDSSVYGGFDYK